MLTQNTTTEEILPHAVVVVVRLPFWLGVPNGSFWVTVDDEPWELRPRNDHVILKGRNSLEYEAITYGQIIPEIHALRAAAELAKKYTHVDIDWDVRTLIFAYPQIETATLEEARSQFRERRVLQRLFLYLNEFIDAYRAADLGSPRAHRAARLSSWDVPNALMFVMRGDRQVFFAEVAFRPESRRGLQGDTYDQEAVASMHTFLRDLELPSPAMILLADALSASERGNYRAALIDAYVAVEEQSMRTLKVALDNQHSPIQNIDAFLDQIGIGIRVTDRCDKLLKSVCGRSLNENRELLKRLHEVRKHRNKAVHRGEWPRESQCVDDVLTCFEVTTWLASVAADLVREGESD